MRSRIMYIELKTGFNDNGPARIGRVSFSRTFQTIYYRGKIFQRLHGGSVAGNWVDVHRPGVLDLRRQEEPPRPPLGRQRPRRDRRRCARRLPPTGSVTPEERAASG
jgi:hypothetical protein